ncbi:MAG: histidine kinase [Bacteroidia bacterium]|nr:histidine kinase [Bacteroidia bacterium]
MKNPLSWQNFWRHPRFWRHVVAWLLPISFTLGSLWLTLQVMPKLAPILEKAIWDLLRFSGFSMVLVYFCLYLYAKFPFPTGKRNFLIGAALAVILVSFLEGLFGPGAVHIGNITGFWANLTAFPVVLLVAFGVKFAWRGLQQKLQIDQLKASQVESELKLLKSQVNPHFLFNTLNNIYATNLENPEKANEIILELADLLRYQLESERQRSISLAKEVSILGNYIHLERIRLRNCEVIFELKGDFEPAKIAPLLLLPFVENAFKYGTGGPNDRIEIRLELTEPNTFHFHCKNGIVQKQGRVHSGGIGLANVKKRLSLLYPGRHKLDLKQLEGFFEVHLSIKLG